MNKYFNIIKHSVDCELMGVKRLIRDYIKQNGNFNSCDLLFLDRLRLLPKAMKIKYWSNHFEWQSLIDYTEINGNILDFGCGTGHSDILLGRAGYRIHGVDLSGLGITIANYLRSKESCEVKERLCFSHGNILTMTFDEKFDSVWSAHVFEHILDPVDIFAGIGRVVKPDATMLISVPLARAYDDPSHVHHFADQDEAHNYFSRYVNVLRVDKSDSYQVLRVLCTFQ